MLNGVCGILLCRDHNLKPIMAYHGLAAITLYNSMHTYLAGNLANKIRVFNRLNLLYALQKLRIQLDTTVGL